MSDSIKVTIDAPAVSPAKDPFLGAVNVITGANAYALFKGAKYTNALNGKNREAPTDGTDKVFDEQTESESFPFVQYRGIDLSLMRHHGEGPALVRAAFDGAEGYFVAAKVQELALNPLAEDITPTAGTPLTNIRHAIGLLEQYAADNYSGEAFISGNRLAVNMIPELKPGSPLQTAQGTTVIPAAGYATDGPNGADAAAGTAWLYISGQINVWSGSVQVLEGPELERNRELALAEAPYAVSVDGFAAAILVGF